MNHELKRSLKKYLSGFVICLTLTTLAYMIVINADSLSPNNSFILIGAIAVLALAQFIVQAIYFLHLDDEKGERWRLASFLSMLSVVLIVVVGSIWIMWNLNYNMMPSMSGSDAEQFIIEDEGFDN